MASYKLFWSALSGSFAPHAVLEELGVDYELQWVDFEGQEHKKSESYLKLNPNGLVPAMVVDGKPMYESAGMVMYLADRHPEAGLCPKASDPERHLYNQWLFYMSVEIYAAVDYVFKPGFLSADPASWPGIRKQAEEKLAQCWQVVDRALEGRRWMAGDRCSACDIYLLMMFVWYIPRRIDVPGLSPMLRDDFIRKFENVTRIASAVAERPAIQKILELYPPEDLARLYGTAV